MVDVLEKRVNTFNLHSMMGVTYKGILFNTTVGKRLVSTVLL